jgi:hypothetical protein
MIITHNGTILTNDGVVLNNIITSPSFINTYSLDFDGVDDYVNIGNGVSFEYTDSFSFSTWINPSAKSGVKYLYSKYISGKGILIYLNSSSTNGNNTLHFNLYNTNSGTLSGRKRITTSDFNFAPINTWVNIVLTYDGSGLASGINYYKNGVLRSSSISQDNLQNQTIVNTEDAYLSSFNGVSSFLLGNQDEFAIYGSELSADDALAIYGTGQPTDLTNLNPIAWYRMGDNGAYKSPQWLIPNNENKDKVSNYSFEFDGMNDYINIPNNTELNFASAYSVSCWIKTTSIALLSPISNQSKFLFRLYAPANQIRLQLYDGSGGFLNLDNTQSFNDGQWHHIAFTTEATTTADKVIVYFDGVALTNKGTQTNVGSQLSAFAYEIGRNSGTWNFNGGIDEVSLYDSELSASQISDIYNGGEPTTISGAVAHYKMGEEATFSGGVWTVPDAVGSNNGTSANMTIEDRVGDAPNSKNNAVSYNMDLIDRVEDTPSTT